MNYKIKINKRAQKFIAKQPLRERERIYAALNKLPEEGDIKAMRGRAEMYRLRVGDYRIIYTVDHNVLTVYVIDAGNRGDVYK